MIPDFPHNIRIRLAHLKKNSYVLVLLCLCPIGCPSLAETANRADSALFKKTPLDLYTMKLAASKD